jgi:hypothetical protein
MPPTRDDASAATRRRDLKRRCRLLADDLVNLGQLTAAEWHGLRRLWTRPSTDEDAAAWSAMARLLDLAVREARNPSPPPRSS